MFRLEDLTLFVRAAALGSFSDAARESGQQPAQVSAAIKRLETILNIRLFARSTRSLRLTPEGGDLAALRHPDARYPRGRSAEDPDPGR